MFEKLSIPIPPTIDLYRRFEIWLVPNRIGVFKKSGFAEIVSLGLECVFPSDDMTLCVVDLLPGPAFVRHGAVSGQLVCKGRFEASGAVSPIPADSGGTSVDSENAPIKFGSIRFGAETSGSAGVEASFSFDISTPYINAVGTGGSQVQWRFDRHDKPLFGRDVEMWTILALSKDQPTLRYRARMFMTARTAFFPTRQETAWQELVCTLEA